MMEHTTWFETREPVLDPKRFSLYTHRARCTCGYRSNWYYPDIAEERLEQHLRREGLPS
jgi:hypothetical protein